MILLPGNERICFAGAFYPLLFATKLNCEHFTRGNAVFIKVRLSKKFAEKRNFPIAFF